MFQETIDIGHYARVPYHVATAAISSRSRDVWTLLAMNCSPENPEVWVRQATLAEQLKCSTDTICRAIQKLLRTKLLLPTQKWHQGRYKIYHLVWGMTFRMDAVQPSAGLQEDPPQNCQPTLLSYRTDAAPPAADLRVDVPQKCGHLNRVLTKQEQNKKEIIFFTPEAQAQKLLADWGDQWHKRFGCLDGFSGRPSIEICVEQAMSHESRHKYASPKVWCEIWLQNAARQWLISFNREQNAVATDPGLDAQAKARRSQAESERSRRYYSQPTAVPAFERNVISPELQAQVDSIMAENEVGFTDKLMKLMKSQRQSLRVAQAA